MSSERAFQQYFMTQVPHGYRTALVSGGGFPDVLMIHGERHSLVELKVIELGKHGDKKLKGLFKPTQPPWFLQYLANGGERLFVVFKIEGNGYGILHVSREFITALDTVRYSDLFSYDYKEYRTLTELVKENFA